MPRMEAVVEILKVGFSGLIFLLAFLAYRLLSKEQDKSKPDTKILNAITSYRAYTLIAAVLTLIVTMLSFFFQERQILSLIQSRGNECRTQIEQIDTILKLNPTPNELRAATGAEVEACRGYVSDLWRAANK